MSDMAKRQIPKVFAVAEPVLALLVIRFCVLVPEQVESVKHRFRASE